MLKAVSGLNQIQVNCWVLLFALWRVCVSDPGGHVYIIGLGFVFDYWSRHQSDSARRACAMEGQLWLSRVPDRREQRASGNNRKRKDLAFHCWCTGLKTFCFNLKESCVLDEDVSSITIKMLYEFFLVKSSMCAFQIQESTLKLWWKCIFMDQVEIWYHISYISFFKKHATTESPSLYLNYRININKIFFINMLNQKLVEHF